MGDDPAAGGEPVLEWGTTARRRVGAWVVLGVGLLALFYAVVRVTVDSVLAIIWPIFLPQLLLVVVPVLVIRFRSGFRADEVGIAIRGPRSGSWRWEEMLEVAAGTSQEIAGPAVAVRPRGSTWDTPGPLAPVLIYLPRRGSLAHAQKVLAAACARHGVAFTTHPDGFGTARPGSPLRRDS